MDSKQGKDNSHDGKLFFFCGLAWIFLLCLLPPFDAFWTRRTGATPFLQRLEGSTDPWDCFFMIYFLLGKYWYLTIPLLVSFFLPATFCRNPVGVQKIVLVVSTVVLLISILLTLVCFGAIISMLSGPK